MTPDKAGKRKFDNLLWNFKGAEKSVLAVSTKRGKQSVEKKLRRISQQPSAELYSTKLRSSLLSSFTCTLSLISNSTCFIGLLLEANCSDFGSGKRKSCGAWVSSGGLPVCEHRIIASKNQKNLTFLSLEILLYRFGTMLKEQHTSLEWPENSRRSTMAEQHNCKTPCREKTLQKGSAVRLSERGCDRIVTCTWNLLSLLSGYNSSKLLCRYYW